MEIESDPGIRNWHLALSADTPDGEIAEPLEQEDERARERGANDLAAFDSWHSARLTSNVDTATAHRRRLLEATHLAVVGQVRKARDVVDKPVASLPPSPDPVEVLIQRFNVKNDDVGVGDATLTSALEDRRFDRALTGRVLDILGWHRGVTRGRDRERRPGPSRSPRRSKTTIYG